MPLHRHFFIPDFIPLVLEYRLDQLSQKIMGRPDEKQLFEERRRIDEEARRRFVEPLPEELCSE